MTTAEAIMKLFDHDDVALRPSEILRRTGRGEFTVRKELTRLVGNRRLFRIGHAQYSRCATTKVIAAMKSDRIAALERRVEELEAKCATLL